MSGMRLLLSLLVCLMGGQALRAGEPAPWRMKPALLVMDVQNQFLPYMSEQDRRLAPVWINEAIGLFRKHGLPVIRVYHTDPGWGPKEGTPAFEYPETLAIKPEDPKVVKHFPSAFKRTDLEKLLREKSVNTLFICGLSATGCALATYRGADDLDFKVFMIKDSLLSPNAVQTAMVQDICNTVNGEVLGLLLESAAK